VAGIEKVGGQEFGLGAHGPMIAVTRASVLDHPEHAVDAGGRDTAGASLPRKLPWLDECRG
jgi:hypothetical protein